MKVVKSKALEEVKLETICDDCNSKLIADKDDVRARPGGATWIARYYVDCPVCGTPTEVTWWLKEYQKREILEEDSPAMVALKKMDPDWCFGCGEPYDGSGGACALCTHARKRV